MWLRVSLTGCNYLLRGGTMIFSFDKSTSPEGGGAEKKCKMKGKNKEIIIAHPLDRL